MSIVGPLLLLFVIVIGIMRKKLFLKIEGKARYAFSFYIEFSRKMCSNMLVTVKSFLAFFQQLLRQIMLVCPKQILRKLHFSPKYIAITTYTVPPHKFEK